MLIPPPKLYGCHELEQYFEPARYFSHYYGDKRPDEFEKESLPFLIKTVQAMLQSQYGSGRSSNHDRNDNDEEKKIDHQINNNENSSSITGHRRRLLQVGLASCGLVLSILAEKYFDEFYFLENLDKVRLEVTGWLKNYCPPPQSFTSSLSPSFNDDFFDWAPVVRHLQYKGVVGLQEEVLISVKNKVKEVAADGCDVTGQNFIRIIDGQQTSKNFVDDKQRLFDAVGSMFHIESRVNNLAKYFDMVRNISTYLKSGGVYIQAGMLNQSYYDAGDNIYFMSLPVKKQQIFDALYAAGIEIEIWNDFEVPYCNASRTTTSPGASMYICKGIKIRSHIG